MRHIVLVVQMPDQKGEGYEYLAADMAPTEFDPAFWKAGKNQKTILALAKMQYAGIGHFHSHVGMKTFVRIMQTELQITNEIKHVKLDFTLPSTDEILSAAKQRTIEEQRAYVQKLEERVQLGISLIASYTTRIASLQTQMEAPHLMEGIRMHIERVLIADQRLNLCDMRKELASTKRKLARARAELRKEQDECVQPPSA